ncbi:GNAT family N-acetyltransferase [Psychroserpens sp. Hel_I_66]|uniref:GNAT family N-acetyltransferase n=1 Tax=Psychroserpens sp. Hel_I_66 TaxID=1250004 RepID=UPI000648EA85|nr:GNAT family N-acetyltransferase [Psychroserpens sp. Hel_I_66]
MSHEAIRIREIRAEDNPQVEAVIKNCFKDFGLPTVGTAYEDAETPFMNEAYSEDRAVYFVVENGLEILGGAGIKQLKDYRGNVCELQKMYFSSKLRGQGFGKKLMEKCLEAAKDFGYEQVYLETIPTLEAAIHIYEEFGFKHRTEPLGNTGHYSCGIWMTKDLKQE